MKRKLLLLFALMAIGLSNMWAQTNFSAVAPTGQTLYYRTISSTDHTCQVVGNYTNLSGTLEIPDTVTNNGITYSVTAIGNFAFAECSGLTSVIIPNSVRTIGQRAFVNCENLHTAIIGDSVTDLGSQVFIVCRRLSKVVVGSGDIGERFFAGDTSLTNITFGCNVKSLHYTAFAPVGEGSIDIDTMYYNARNLSISDNGGENDGFKAIRIKHLVIGDSVKIIPARAFQYQDSLSSVVMGNAIDTIGAQAFEHCSKLSYVNIPNSVKCLDGNTFAYCTNIDTLILPSSIQFLGDLDFEYCDTIHTVYYNIPNPIGYHYNELYNTRYYSFHSFEGTKIQELHLGDSVRNIPWSFFGGQSALTQLNIPDSVNRIECQAFNGCTGLRSVTIGDGLTYLDQSAFSGCNNVDTLYYNARNLRIFEDNIYYAYRGSDYGFNSMPLSHVVIGDGVKVIPTGLFYGQRNLSEVAIPNSVDTIRCAAFKESGISSVHWGDSLKSIGEYAFQSCDSLSSVAFPNSVTELGMCAFNGCTNLKVATIPSSIKTLPDGVFLGCQLDTVYWGINEKIETPVNSSKFTFIDKNVDDDYCSINTKDTPNVSIIQDSAFRNCTTLKVFTMPNNVVSIGSDAFRGCWNLQSISLPPSLEQIGDAAFYDCSNLRTIFNLSNMGLTLNSDDNGMIAKNAYRIIQGGDLTIYNGCDANLGNRVCTSENALVKVTGDYTLVSYSSWLPSEINKNDLPVNFYIADGNGSYYARKIVLTDGKDNPFYTPDEFSADAVEYIREYSPNNRSTLYLPFDVDNVPTDMNVYTFSDFDNDNILYFQDTDAVKAYRPYLVTFTPAKGSVSWSANSIVFPRTPSGDTSYVQKSNDNMYARFVGTVTRKTMSNSNYYGYKDGYFVQSGGSAHVNPFRCFFTLSGSQSAPATLSVDTDGDYLGIEDVDGDMEQTSIRYSNDVYDMMGRLVRKDADNLRGLPRGIYIWRGKKQIAY